MWRAISVAARFGALCDDDVRTALQGSVGVAQSLDLADQSDAPLLHALGERHGIVERQKNRFWIVGERQIEKRRLFAEGPSDEAAAYGLISGGAKLLCEPISITVSAANEAETAGCGSRCSQPPAGGKGHRC